MSKVLHEFTTTVPFWRPRITPIELADANAEQLEALKVTPSNTKVSEYVLVLARDAQTLHARTPLFNAIMYNRGGLSRAERELSATGASVVNQCIYCAAVHASRYNALTKNESVMASVFEDGTDAELDPRTAAILRTSAKLSATPPDLGVDDMQTLREAGLGDDEILDLVLSSALFGWANRLMHTLGDPIEPSEP